MKRKNLDSNALDERLLQSRKHHFKVEVTPAKQPMEAGEVSLSMTTNGLHWTTIRLLKSEAAKVIEALSNLP